MKKIIKISLLVSSLLLIGCSDKIDPTPKAVDLKSIQKEMYGADKMEISIIAGESFKDLIKKVQKENSDKIFIDKTSSDILFQENLPQLSFEELQKYIKLTLNRDITLRKYSERIYSFEENVFVSKKDYSKQGSYKLPDTKVEFNGDFTYEEAFNLLREQGINIYVDIYDTKRSLFKYENKIPKFSGNIKMFLDFIAAKERFFIIYENEGIRLKDVETVTYNLKLPKVKLDPVLAPDGTPTAVTISGSLSSSSSNTANGTGTSTGLSSSTNSNSNSTTNNSTVGGTSSRANNNSPGIGTLVGKGDMSPLKDFKDQLKDMLENKAIFSLNETQGTLSVTGDFESIKTADKLVEDFHDIYGKAIKLEFHVYEVSLSNKNAFGIDYNLLKTQLIADSIQTKVGIDTGLTNALTLGSESANQQFFSKNGTLITSEGSQAVEKTQGLIFKYLNKYGRTSVITKPTLGTINNLPVKLDVVDSIDYVYSIQQNLSTTTTTGVSNTSSTNEPEIRSVVTGFSLVLHPKLEGEFIKVAIKNITSTLNGLTPYTYGENGENVIRLKDVSAREFDETIKIKEGEIAIIGGYMYEKKNSLKNGLPYTGPEDTVYDALTSAKETNTEKVEIVVTISAKII